MTVIVQDDAGSVADANAYLAVADFKTYHDDRGNDYSAYDDTAIGQAVIRASDYVDTRFHYQGRRTHRDQTTQWPRAGVYDRDGFYVTGVPRAVSEATAEYALRALSGDLMPDPTLGGKSIVAQTKKVGPITTSVEYGGEGAAVLNPKYPLADNILRKAGLVASGNTVSRA